MGTLQRLLRVQTPCLRGAQGGAVAKVANVINLYFEGNWCPLQARGSLPRQAASPACCRPLAHATAGAPVQ